MTNTTETTTTDKQTGGSVANQHGAKSLKVRTEIKAGGPIFFVLVLLAVAWWLVKAVLGTVLFFGKLAILALLVAVAIRAYLWARSRLRRTRPS